MTDEQKPNQYDPLERLHARLDDVFDELSCINKQLATTTANCVPCQLAIKQHAATIYGNGQPGLTSRLTGVEQGRVDTLSMKSVLALFAAIGTLLGVVGGLVGGRIAADSERPAVQAPANTGQLGGN